MMNCFLETSLAPVVSSLLTDLMTFHEWSVYWLLRKPGFTTLQRQTYLLEHYCFLQIVFISLCLLEGGGEDKAGPGKHFIIPGKAFIFGLIE